MKIEIAEAVGIVESFDPFQSFKTSAENHDSHINLSMHLPQHCFWTQNIV